MDETHIDFWKWFRELNDFEIGDVKTYYGGTVANPIPPTPTEPEPGWITLPPYDGT